MKQQTAYANFINTCRSEETKKTYNKCLNNFMKFVKINDYESLLKLNAEDRIKQYIISRQQQVSSATVHKELASVLHFYDMNDVLLNKVKLAKYKGEFKKVVKDRAYTHAEISKLLANADLRLKCCILLMASSGLRLGALPDIKLEHLRDNVLTVYEGSSEEYNTFVTQETLTTIKEYLDYRARSGEKVTPKAYLIRNNFDSFVPEVVRDSKKISKHTLRNLIYNALKKTGLDDNDVMVTHGFRKFFTTQLITSKVNPEIRELLLGHKIGLTGAYYRPTVEQMYEEYEKAIDLLTINEEHRLKKKLDDKIPKIETAIKQIQEMATSMGFSFPSLEK